MARTYEHLDIWKESIQLAELIYTITRRFPRDELYGIISQMRRAAISISSNIAEGSGRASKKDFAHFITIAIGSLNELESLAEVSHRLKFIAGDDHEELKLKIGHTGKLLGGFRKYLAGA